MSKKNKEKPTRVVPKKPRRDLSSLEEKLHQAELDGKTNLAKIYRDILKKLEE